MGPVLFSCANVSSIIEAGGFVDSFAGDEIKVLFDTSPDEAVRAGVNMCRSLEKLNSRSVAMGQPALEMGIGVDIGQVVLGTVGGPNRIQCSVVGDVVNLASRIEQLTKVYGSRFLISGKCFQGLDKPDDFSIRKIDRVVVKGKREVTDIYEVIDAEDTAQRSIKISTRSLLNEALDSYYGRNFETAELLFEKMSAQNPDDAVPKIFAERCSKYIVAPPEEWWHGFERLAGKQSM